MDLIRNINLKLISGKQLTKEEKELKWFLYNIKKGLNSYTSDDNRDWIFYGREGEIISFYYNPKKKCFLFSDQNIASKLASEFSFNLDNMCDFINIQIVKKLPIKVDKIELQYIIHYLEKLKNVKIKKLNVFE